MERIEFRNSKFIIFKKIIGLFIAVGFFLARLIDDVNLFKEGSFAFIILGVVCLLLIVVILNAYIKWKNTVYTISDGYLNYRYNGILRKKNKEVRLSQISNINLERSIVDKIFSLGKIKIDISSSHTASKTDFEILVAMKDSDIIKGMLSSHIGESPIREVFNQAVEELVVVKDYTSIVGEIEKIDFRNIFNKSIVSKSISKAEYDGETYTRNFSTWEGIRHSLLDISILNILFFAIALFMMFSEIKGKGGIIGLFIILRGAFDVFKSISEKTNFSCRRSGDYIEIKYGLMNTDKFTLPIDKITGIASNQSMFSRIFAYTSIKITAVGFGNDKSENQLIGLYLKDSQAKEFLSRVLPEYQLQDQYRKQSTVVLFVSLFFQILIFSLLGYTLGGFFHGYKIHIYIVCIILGCLIASMGYLNEGLFITDKSIVIQKGIFKIVRETIEYDEIDQVVLVQGAVYQLFGLKKIRIMYKGNSGPKILLSGYYSDSYFCV